MDRENKETKVRGHHYWGWILAIIGGILIPFGLFLLIIEISIMQPDWYIGILVFSVPSFLLGIPLLVIGIHRIKNIDKYEEINGEFVNRNNKKQLIWGWISAIIGGVFGLLVLDTMVMIMFGGTNDGYDSIFIYGVPSLLLGGTLLIFGVRNIKVVKDRAKTNSENKVDKAKKSRVWGWIFVVVGGLIILVGIGILSFFYYVMFILSPQKGIVELYEGYNTMIVLYSFSLFALPVLLAGLSLVILGYTMLKKNEISHQSRGWILNLMGGLYIIAAVLSIYYVALTYADKVEIGIAFTLWSPFMILGLLGIVFGIREITHNEKLNPENFISLGIRDNEG